MKYTVWRRGGFARLRVRIPSARNFRARSPDSNSLRASLVSLVTHE